MSNYTWLCQGSGLRGSCSPKSPCPGASFFNIVFFINIINLINVLRRGGDPISFYVPGGGGGGGLINEYLKRANLEAIDPFSKRANLGAVVPFLKQTSLGTIAPLSERVNLEAKAPF